MVLVCVRICIAEIVGKPNKEIRVDFPASTTWDVAAIVQAHFTTMQLAPGIGLWLRCWIARGKEGR